MSGAMPDYATTLAGTRYTFADLREVMAKASPLRSGDCLGDFPGTMPYFIVDSLLQCYRPATRGTGPGHPTADG